MSYFDPGDGNMVMVDGMMVERDALSIAEKIHEYDENLEVMCLDPSYAQVNEAPFVIVERRGDILIRVFEAWELDERILDRLYLSDRNRTDVQNLLAGKQLEIRNARESRYKEKKDKSNEMILDIIKSPKSSYSVKKDNGDILTHYENRPPELNSGKKSYS